jgi:DNA-binding CsgD family transcriptional regulator
MGGRVASPTLVGRVEELEVLEAARRRAADGAPAVVLVGGEAGVGKTRLVAELTARCAIEGTRVLAGGCVPVGGDGLPYAPIVEALRPLLHELGIDAVRELAGPSWHELGHLLPSLGEPEVGPAGPAAQARLFELLLGLLARLSEQAPLVVVVEDLHWADQSTRNLLAFLVRNLRRERVLLLGTFRTDEPGLRWLGPWLAELDRGGQVERIELARLDQSETFRQLLGILEAEPVASLVDAVFARSQGNPLFTEELLESVRAGSSALPSTLRDLLRGRVEALPERARQVVRVAAVAGRQVPHWLLAAVVGVEDLQLENALRAAVEDQLLVTRGDGYDFRHGLLREVVDAALLPGERARLHAAYAHALTERSETAGGSSSVAAAELAAHWDAAGEPTQALPARVRAGLAAERARAFAEAARHYQRALELWDIATGHGPPVELDRVEVLTRAGEMAALTGTAGRAVVLLEQALDRVDRVAEPVRAAVLLARLGSHRERAGDEPGALGAFGEAERLLAGTPASTERARVLASHARTLRAIWRGPEAIPYCEEAIAVAHAIGALAEEAHALSTLGMCLDDLGRPDEAITLHLEARRIAENIGDAEGIVQTYVNVSHMLWLAGREQDAIRDAYEGYQRARQLGLERATGSAVADNLAWHLLSSGRWEECERLTAELLAADSWSASHLHTNRGLLLTYRGDFAAARKELDAAVRLSPPAYLWSAWLGRAELALWEGRHDEASTAIDEGSRWCAQLDPDGTLPQISSVGYPLTLRLEADRAEEAAARRAPEEVAEARRRAAPVITELDRLAKAQPPQVGLPPVVCNLLLARAEQSRLEGRTDPEQWQAAAAAWGQSERPFKRAYARFREAEALLASGSSRPQAEQALREAHQTAISLGAGPLRREIELLAQRGRLRLEEPIHATSAPQAPSALAASLGLTRREMEVLALVAEGRTNRQIGQALFITPKTAGVHVSRILAKLGVAGRGEAAAVAHRLGLDKP